MVFENAILFSPLHLPLFLNVREAIEQKNCPYFRSSQMHTCRCVPTGERIALSAYTTNLLGSGPTGPGMIPRPNSNSDDNSH